MKINDKVRMKRTTEYWDENEFGTILDVHPDGQRILVQFSRKMHNGPAFIVRTVCSMSDFKDNRKKINPWVTGIRTCNNCCPVRRCKTAMQNIDEVCKHYTAHEVPRMVVIVI